MKTADDLAFDLITHWEGYSAASYLCPAGVWTVGYGATGPTIGPHTVWEKDRAVDDLKKRLGHDRHVIEAMTLDCPATPRQMAAFLSFTYNVGLRGFEHSTVRREHNAKNFKAAADGFLLWDKAHVGGGDSPLVVVAGLHDRRVSEREMYLAGSPAPL